MLTTLLVVFGIGIAAYSWCLVKTALREKREYDKWKAKFNEEFYNTVGRSQDELKRERDEYHRLRQRFDGDG